MKHFKHRFNAKGAACWLAPMSLLAAAAHAAPPEDPFDDRFYAAPMLSYVLADDARNAEDGWGGTLAVGKRLLPRFELELRGSYLKYEGKDIPRELLGNVLCGLLPCEDRYPDHELSAGGIGGNLFLSPTGRGLFLHGDAQYGESEIYNAGLGVQFGRETMVRIEALYHWDSDDTTFEEVQLNLGLRIPLGRRAASPPPPAPEPVQVVPPQPAPPPPVPPAAPAPPPKPLPPCEMPDSGSALSLEGCESGDRFVLHGVNFEFDQSRLTINAKTLLDHVADALRARPDIRVRINGHTDALGAEDYNQDLSQRRAQAVADYLVSRGIGAERLSSAGFGETLPIADNADEEGRELNRRVELQVL